MIEEVSGHIEVTRKCREFLESKPHLYNLLLLAIKILQHLTASSLTDGLESRCLPRPEYDITNPIFILLLSVVSFHFFYLLRCI